MAKRKKKVDPEKIDTDNPEWTREDFARARPASEVLPASLMRKVRGKQKSPTKELISIRLPTDVLGRFRASGPGWQGKVVDAMRAYLKSHRI